MNRDFTRRAIVGVVYAIGLIATVAWAQDVLSPAPTTCDSPLLLIRNTANLNWFTAGILEQD